MRKNPEKGYERDEASLLGLRLEMCVRERSGGRVGVELANKRE
jgi:hypothetical protein